MALSVSFSTNQVVGAPQNVVLVDSTTGSDVSAVSRRVSYQTAISTYLVPDGTTTNYIEWPLADGNTLTSDILATDQALNVTLAYVDISGNTVASLTALRGFTLYNETFYYSLTQAQAMQNQPPPMIIQDSNYFSNKLILRTLIDSGNQSIELGGDITSAQNNYDQATFMILNENDYF